jgi:hypothetical protein
MKECCDLLPNRKLEYEQNSPTGRNNPTDAKTIIRKQPHDIH